MRQYVDEETVVGTYNGYPLYRKVCHPTIAKSTWTNIPLEDLGLEDIDKIAKWNCKIHNNNGTTYDMNYFLYSSRWGFCFFDLREDVRHWQYYYTDTSTTVTSCDLEVFYTKGEDMILDKLYPMDNVEHKLGENKYIKHFTGTTIANDRYTIVAHGLTNVSMIHCYGSIVGGSDNQSSIVPNNKLNDEWDWGMGCDSVNYSISCPTGSSCRNKTYHVWLIYSKNS